MEYSRFDGMTPLQKAEMYACDIMGSLNAGTSGSVDWNLLLDAKGGPNYVGNLCETPVMLNQTAALKVKVTLDGQMGFVLVLEPHNIATLKLRQPAETV